MENNEFYLLEQYLLFTDKHIFLTGKAGTGKTTFLKNIIQRINKNYAIIAPTGVAAVNAGGMTIHSFLQLPIANYIPSNEIIDVSIAMNRHALASRFRHNTTKIKLLQELELLIIDEISMVRCDMMDAIDFVLRHVRKNNKPFGGVQLLMIGDLFQLSPVIKSTEWNTLSKYYLSSFFYGALVWKEDHFHTITLKKVYRQAEGEFLDILNSIRNGSQTEDLISKLNSRFNKDFVPKDSDQYITLTTHNSKAEVINNNKINALKEKEYAYKAVLSGNFNENGFPNEEVLKLRKGSQVMFIKNDIGGLYYNGLIGKVIDLNDDDVTVDCNGTVIHTGYVTWKNVKYKLNENNNKIEEEEDGSFTQIPLKLAWAVTVHKSQGLTFEKVILDLEDSFAAGQAYVALSRCTSLEGIVLSSELRFTNVIKDSQVADFYTKESIKENDLLSILPEARHEYENTLIKKVFSISPLINAFDIWLLDTEEVVKDKKQEINQLKDQLKKVLDEILLVSENFQKQMGLIIVSKNRKALIERSEKAIDYFSHRIYLEVLKTIHVHLKSHAKSPLLKKYIRETLKFYNRIWLQLKSFYLLQIDGQAVYQAKRYTKEDIEEFLPVSKIENQKLKVKNTMQDTLVLFEEGKSIAEIAKLRGLAEGTIETHLAKYISDGKITISQVMDLERYNMISPYVTKDVTSFAELKSKIPFATTYTELRFVHNHLKFEEKK
ncbi:MAG: hypothetical protein RLZZ546_2987 [Bacteroidota bacterium]|jgi:hypothetical protein